MRITEFKWELPQNVTDRSALMMSVHRSDPFILVPLFYVHGQCAYSLEEVWNNGFHIRDSFKAVFLLMDI